MEKNEVVRDERRDVYEVGFHIVPIVSAENLPAEVDAIRSLIQKKGGEIIAEDAPKMRNLAYTISKKIGGVYRKYDTAHFGWIKFETVPEAVVEFKTAIDNNDNILRYIIIKTVRENTLIGQKMLATKDEAVKEPVKKEKKEGESGKPELSPEEIDKTIDQMVME